MPEKPDPAPAPPTGRAARTRQAIEEAYLELLRSGETPTSTTIAQRAGVTQRTLFNHFADTAALLGSIAERQGEWLRTNLPEPTQGQLEERAHAYVAQLAPVLEQQQHVRWSATVFGAGTELLIQTLATVRRMVRRRLAALVGDDASGLTPAEKSTLLDALESATDPLTWRVLRTQQGLSMPKAQAVVERTVLGLLHDATRSKQRPRPAQRLE